MLELDAVLSRLEAISPRQAKAVELRFFGDRTLAPPRCSALPHRRRCATCGSRRHNLRGI
jgi:hypothetical protein